MTIGEVEDPHPFLDFDRTVFPHLKALEQPSLTDLYQRVERARYIRWGLYAGATVFAACALPGLVHLIAARTAAYFAALAVTCFVSSILFHKPPPYLILGIDGGGIRGMIPIQILALIEKEVGRPIGELFDCIAGTSIGGIIALALVQPDPNNPSKPKRTAAEVAQFIEKEGPLVFERTRFQTIKVADGVWAPKYSNENLKNILEREFKDAKLSQAVTDVLIPSYDLSKGRPAIFSHFKGDTKQTSFSMKDAGMATSAAPIYFPSYSVQDNGYVLNFVDGGLIANNPTLLAFMKAKGHVDPQRDIFILSIGTGQMVLRAITPQQSEKYGMIQWLPIIFDLIFQSSQEMLTLQFKLLKHVGERYIGERSFSMVRMQPQLETPAQEHLDNSTPENVQTLKALATRYFNENYSWIQKELIEPLKKYRAPSTPPTAEKTQRLTAPAA